MRLSCYVLLVLYLWCFTFKSVYAQCTRQAADKLSFPNFLCTYTVNVTRVARCSTKVVESIVFPHSSGNPWRRDIPFLPFQSINSTSISVSRDGRPTNFKFDKWYRVTVPAQQTDEPVRFDLSYSMHNGAMQYGERCNFDNDSDTDNDGFFEDFTYNIFFWSLGHWDQQVDSLTVSFTTKSKTAHLRFPNGENADTSALQISKTVVNVSTDVQFYVLENSTKACAKEYRCENSRHIPSQNIFMKWGLIFWFAYVLGTVLFCSSGMIRNRGVPTPVRDGSYHIVLVNWALIFCFVCISGTVFVYGCDMVANGDAGGGGGGDFGGVGGPTLLLNYPLMLGLLIVPVFVLLLRYDTTYYGYGGYGNIHVLGSWLLMLFFVVCFGGLFVTLCGVICTKRGGAGADGADDVHNVLVNWVHIFCFFYFVGTTSLFCTDMFSRDVDDLGGCFKVIGSAYAFAAIAFLARL